MNIDELNKKIENIREELLIRISQLEERVSRIENVDMRGINDDIQGLYARISPI